MSGRRSYACFADNPILIIDPNGDIFKVGKNKDGTNNSQAVNDVKALPEDERNQKYVKIGGDGTVSLDFGDMEADEKELRIASDKGLTLIESLVNAKEKGTDGKEKDLVFIYNAKTESIYPELAFNITNQSVRDRWADADAPGLKSERDKYKNNKRPAEGDGYVNISPGVIYDDKGQKVSRASIVMHELYESYIITAHHIPYKYFIKGTFEEDPKRKGAHKLSIDFTGNAHGNNRPGYGSGYTIKAW